MKGKNDDYKEAYNKNLTAKARLHYLENARNDQDSPNNMCSPAHYGDSPLNQFGSLASIASGFANQQPQQSIGTTGGALSNAMASVMNTGQTPSATSTTSGALAGATPNAGMLSGVNTQGGGDVESRITALEQNAPSNTLGNAKPVFNSQAQQAAQGIYGSVDQRQNSVGASPIFQKNQFGNTKEEQAKLNSANKSKQEKFKNEYNNYKTAVYDKKNWEETENDFGFAGKEYPKQRTLDSLRTVYRNKK